MKVKNGAILYNRNVNKKNRKLPGSAKPPSAPPSDLPLSRALMLTFAGAWALVFFFIYHKQAWPNVDNLFAMLDSLRLPDRAAFLVSAGRLALVAWLCILMLLIGRGLLKIFGLTLSSRLETAAFSAGLGAGAMIMGLFLLGTAGLLRTPVVLGACIFFTLILTFLQRDLLQKNAAPSPKVRWTPADRVLAGLLVLTGLVYLTEALAPEIFYDSLVYHLAVPKLWWLERRMVPTPANCFSGIPFNIEMLFGLGLALSGDVAAKLLHYACGAGAVAAIMALARRYGSPRAGWLAALLFVGPPMVALEFGKTAIELGTTLFVVLSVFSLALGLEESRPEIRWRWLALSGLFCGLNMGTKYTAWIFYPALAFPLFLHWKSRGEGDNRAVKDLVREQLLIAVPAAAVVLPWIVKNILFYKNPIYPFLTNIFANPANGLSNFAALKGEAGRNLAAQFGSWRGALNYLLEPWTVSLNGRTDADYLGPAFLIFIPLLLFIRWRPATTLLLRIFFLQWLLYSVSSFVARFWIPSLAILAVLIGIAMADGEMPKPMKAAALALALVAGAVNLSWSWIYLYMMEGWRVVQGDMAAAEYLNRPHSTYPNPYYAAANFINQNAPPEAKVMVLGDARAFYLERPYFAATVYDRHPVFDWTKECADGEALYRKFRDAGVTHVLLNVAEGVRVRHYWLDNFSEEGAKVFDDFWRRHVRLVLDDQGSTREDYRYAQVYEIVAERSANEEPPQNVFWQILQKKG